MREQNRDTYEIKNYELTPEGYLKTWLVGGVANKRMNYDAGNRVETINETSLFNPDSVNTAVGKPIILNHAPKAVNSSNFHQYAKGTLLQQFEKDGDKLVLAGIIHDKEVVERIMDGTYKHVSATYWADKQKNQDGTIQQSNRTYTDLAILTPDYIPRAGEESVILKNSDSEENQEDKGSSSIDDSKDDCNDTSNSDSKPEFTDFTATVNSSPSTNDNVPNRDNNKDNQLPTVTKNNEPQQDSIAEKVELLASWKPVLDSKNKSINYDASIRNIKKDILSCYYPEKTIKLVNDANIDGMWLGFLTNPPQTDADGKDSLPENMTGYNFVNRDSMQLNYDSVMETERDKLRKIREGVA